MSDTVRPPRDRFNVGVRVRKVAGYTFDGTIRASFLTKSGQLRYVVEHDASEGLLHIFGHDQLASRPALGGA